MVTGIVICTGRDDGSPTAITTISYLPALTPVTPVTCPLFTSIRMTPRGPLMRSRGSAITAPVESYALMVNGMAWPAVSTRLAGSATMRATRGAGGCAGAAGCWA
jgi:hypothetical protein